MFKQTKKTVFSPSLWTIRAMFDSSPPQNQSKTALLQQTLHTLFSRNSEVLGNTGSSLPLL